MKENGILSKVRIYSSERRGRRENSITKLRIKEKDQATKSGESREEMLHTGVPGLHIERVK